MVISKQFVITAESLEIEAFGKYRTLVKCFKFCPAKSPLPWLDPTAKSLPHPKRIPAEIFFCFSQTTSDREVNIRMSRAILPQLSMNQAQSISREK